MVGLSSLVILFLPSLPSHPVRPPKVGPAGADRTGYGGNEGYERGNRKVSEVNEGRNPWHRLNSRFLCLTVLVTSSTDAISVSCQLLPRPPRAPFVVHSLTVPSLLRSATGLRPAWRTRGDSEGTWQATVWSEDTDRNDEGTKGMESS